MATTSKTTAKNQYLLILCGGSGPRLWPYSRASYPKQFLNLVGQGSLLQQTVTRSLRVVPKENIYIISNQRYLKEIQKQLKGLIVDSNIISEPQKKNTAAAILYGCAVIRSKNPSAVVSALPSDHYISRLSSYESDLKKASRLAAGYHKIILIGITPTRPDPSYGYLSLQPTSHGFSKVKKFIEKPDPKAAAKLISANALWNSGMYTFEITTLLSEFAKHQPEYHKLFLKLEENLNSRPNLEKVYDLFPNLSIDYAVSEKSDQMAAIPARFAWSDIGEWETLRHLIKPDSSGNSLVVSGTPLVTHNSSGCLVAGTRNKLIGLVGVNNLAVIDTSDGLLVCNLNDSLTVRDLVGKIVKDPSLQNYFLQQNDQRN